MSNPRPSSTKIRREVFERCKFTEPVSGRIMMICHICGVAFNPATTEWEAEHVIRRSLKGDDSPSNILPAHKTGCHEEKTREDISDNAKGIRVRDRHFNIRQKKGRPMPGSKRSGWKKTFADGWVKR